MKNNKKIIILSSVCHAFGELYKNCQSVDIPTPKKLQTIEINQDKNDLNDNELLNICRNNILTNSNYKIKNVYTLEPIKEVTKVVKNCVNPNERNRNIKKFR